MACVRYLVRDVEEAVAFYSKHLGFKLEQQFGPAVALVSRDDLTSCWPARPRRPGGRCQMAAGLNPVGGIVS